MTWNWPCEDLEKEQVSALSGNTSHHTCLNLLACQSQVTETASWCVVLWLLFLWLPRFSQAAEASAHHTGHLVPVCGGREQANWQEGDRTEGPQVRKCRALRAREHVPVCSRGSGTCMGHSAGRGWLSFTSIYIYFFFNSSSIYF